jgi:hypothetical protein
VTTGYALIVDGDGLDLDGAVVELSHNGDKLGVVYAEVRIPARQRDAGT